MNTENNVVENEEIDLNETFLTDPPMLVKEFSEESDKSYQSKMDFLNKIHEQVLKNHPELLPDDEDKFDITPFLPSERYRYTDISYNIRSGNSDE
jgi:hypothetical protein